MLQVMTITIAQKEEASVWNQLWENQPIPVASPITVSYTHLTLPTNSRV